MTLIQTNRLGLPLLAAGQAQKEVTHNEALLLLDLIGQPVVESCDNATPPEEPMPGQCWIVGSPADAAWSGADGAIAGWTDTGWRFVHPGAGWRVWVLDRSLTMRFDGAAWLEEALHSDGFFLDGQRVLGPRQAGIANPDGGAVIDAEGRSALIAILAALRAHGLIEP